MCFITENNWDDSPKPDTEEENPTNYDIVPRTEAAIKADSCLHQIQPWLETLQQPEDLTDTEYKMFMWYCTWVWGPMLVHGSTRLILIYD